MQMVPFMFVMLAGIIVSIIQIIVTGTYGIVFAIIWTIFDIYILLCIYSHYQWVKVFNETYAQP